jgi:hypothetical protein
LLWQTFLISQIEVHFERMMISDNLRDYEKIADRAMHDPKKGIPGLFPEVAMALGAVHQCGRGVL